MSAYTGIDLTETVLVTLVIFKQRRNRVLEILNVVYKRKINGLGENKKKFRHIL